MFELNPDLRIDPMLFFFKLHVLLDFDNTDGVSDPEEGLAEEDSGSEAEDQMGGGGLPAGVNIVGTHPIYGPLVDMGSQGLVPLMVLVQMQMQGGEAASEDQNEESDDEECSKRQRAEEFLKGICY